MTVRALVTGGNGFVAQWAMRAMLARGWSVCAAGIGPMPKSVILTSDERAAIRWRELDITRQEQIAETVHDARPTVVLHLAAVSHVPHANENPGYAYEVNVVGTVRLLTELERMKTADSETVSVLVVGSAEQYGRHESAEMPLDETSEQRPLTLYAASKAAQEIAALQTFRTSTLRIVCTRSFNHSGVGHASNFLLPGMILRAMKLRHTGGALSIGNADTVRDFLHVSDVATAYLDLLDKGVGGEAYNVCSGDGVSVRALAEEVLRRANIDAEVVVDQEKVRAVDVPVLIGSNAKLSRHTGWSPTKTRGEIIDDLIYAATN